MKSFRPAGIGRYFVAAFLAVWLAGWIVGEVFAVAALAAIVASLTGAFPAHLPSWGEDMVRTGGIAFAVLFLVLWIALWTIGGVTALTHAMRLLAGEDLIAPTASGLELVRRAGPFRRRFRFDRAAIRRIRARPHDGALMMDTASGTRVLTSFGSRIERQAVVGWLNQHLNLPGPEAVAADGMVPPSWEVRTDADVTSVRKSKPRVRAIRAVGSWILAGATAIAWIASNDGASAIDLPGLVATLLVVLGAVAITWSRREWIVRRGEATLHWRVAVWTSERTFRHAHLDVTHSTDSDNDSHYKLVITDAQGMKTVHSQVHDSGEVVDLGHWFAARTGFPFSIRT